MYYATLLIFQFIHLTTCSSSQLSNSSPNTNTTTNTYTSFISICAVIILCLILILCELIFLSYISNDDLVFEVRALSGSDDEKKSTEKIKPLLNKRHWLSSTLFIFIKSSLIYIIFFLETAFDRKLSIIISLILIITIDTIIPQTFINTSNQISFACRLYDLTYSLMLVSCPLTYPLSKVLERLLGEKHKYRLLNSDIKALIELHKINHITELTEGMNGVITQLPQNINSESINNNNNNNNSHQQHTKRSSDSFEFNRSSNVVSIQNKMGLHDEEANLMISALEIREKQAIELMIPFTSTFMVDYDEKLDKSKLRHILNKGYSRIPVYGNHNRQDILGLVRIKQLILLDKYTNKSLRDLGIRLKTPLVIHPSLNVFELLKEFRKGKSHMAFVTEQVNKLQSKFGLSRTNSIAVNNAIVFNKNIEIHIMGIITLEDVIEHIFNLEIYDEDDYEKMKGSNTGMFVVSGNKEIKKLEMIEECSKGNDESVNVNVNVNVDVYSSGNKDSSKKDNLLYESSLFNDSLGNKKYNEKLII